MTRAENNRINRLLSPISFIGSGAIKTRLHHYRLSLLYNYVARSTSVGIYAVDALNLTAEARQVVGAVYRTVVDVRDDEAFAYAGAGEQTSRCNLRYLYAALNVELAA